MDRSEVNDGVLLEPGFLDSAQLGTTEGVIDERAVDSFFLLMKAYMENGGVDYETASDQVSNDTVPSCACMGERGPVVVYDERDAF